jgi:integrase
MSVYRRGGREFWTIEVKDLSGRLVRRGSGTSSKRLALSRKEDWQRAVDDFKNERITAEQFAIRWNTTEASKVTLRDHVDDYIRSLELRLGEKGKRSLSKLYYEAARGFLTGKSARKKDGAWLGERLGVTDLSLIAKESIEKYLQKRRERDRMRARTLNYELALVSGFLEWCKKTKRIAVNVAREVEKYDVDADRAYERRALTDEEIESLFQVAERHGVKAYYAMAYYCGLRKSELARVTWPAVDLDAATLTIDFGKAKRNDCLPIAPPLLDELKRLKDAQGPVLPTARLFPHPPKNEERRRHYLEAGIELLNKDGAADLHSLRSSLAGRLAKQGVAPFVARDFLRHANVATTEKHYVKLRLGDLQVGVAALVAPTDEKETQRATGTFGEGGEMGREHGSEQPCAAVQRDGSSPEPVETYSTGSRKSGARQTRRRFKQ